MIVRARTFSSTPRLQGKAGGLEVESDNDQ